MNSYDKYKAHQRKISDIAYASALLQWDQEVYMPPAGAAFRAQQLATLAGMVHELAVEEDFGTLLEELNKDESLSEKESVNVAHSLKDYRKQQKYTTRFVKTLSQTISEAFQAWRQAKKKNDFTLFATQLEKLVKLKREECELLGYQEHPYDALLDEYEQGTTTSDIERLFADVKKQLPALVAEIAQNTQHSDDFMHKHYEKNKQWDFGIYLLEQMGYDFNAGRQDISTHPFTTNFSPQDVRVTTRVNENDFREMTWSCIHEGGHALYEQGLNPDDYGLPTGEYISLGIHESQSRLWENHVGRGIHYWKANYCKLQETFPENLGNVSLEEFYKAVNTVKPSLVRTAADELTYHFHILIRFEIEKALIGGELDVKDIPDCWNSKYKEYLGIDVPSDDKGILQDIHWSHGSFGYFPTYSLGSFYAAQFYAKAKQDTPDLEHEIEKGNMKPLLDWLRTHIHRHGKFFTAEEICVKATGESLNFKYFMDYAKNKYAELYHLEAV